MKNIYYKMERKLNILAVAIRLYATKDIKSKTGLDVILTETFLKKMVKLWIGCYKQLDKILYNIHNLR